MDAFLTPRLTEKGISMVIRAIYGDSITFTKISMGNGVPSDLNNVTEMVNPLLDIPFVEATQEDNYILLTGETSSSQIETSFYGNELGVYAKDENDNEYLYAYRYSEQADFFPASSEGRTIELRISVAVAVGNAENVTAILTAGEEYATRNEFNAHVNDHNNPHHVTAEDVGLGNVSNESPENLTPSFTQASSRTNIVSGDTLSVILGKIAKVISDFTSHLTATNPHGITAAGISAAPKTHTHSASDINAGTLSVARGGTGQTSLDNVTVGKAKQLNTARKLKVALGSTTDKTFNGTADVTDIPISGTLAIGNGGTGQTTLDLAVGTAGARSIYAGTGGMTAGTTNLTTGRIYLQYI